MDGLQLRDEAVRDRIRAAEEFLDPSQYTNALMSALLTNVKMTDLIGVTDPPLLPCCRNIKGGS